MWHPCHPQFSMIMPILHLQEAKDVLDLLGDVDSQGLEEPMDCLVNVDFLENVDYLD